MSGKINRHVYVGCERKRWTVRGNGRNANLSNDIPLMIVNGRIRGNVELQARNIHGRTRHLRRRGRRNLYRMCRIYLRQPDGKWKDIGLAFFDLQAVFENPIAPLLVSSFGFRVSRSSKTTVDN